MTRIIFTGITGLLGKYFLKNKEANYEVIGIRNKKFKVDITKKKLVSEFIKKTNPDIVVHAASIGSVDYCEKYPKKAFQVNVEGTKNIIEAAKKVHAKIIFISSNAVFDGSNPPYREEDLPNPIDIYGKTKLEGEKEILKSGLDFCILRLITMYGWPNPGARSNPVVWFLENLRKKQAMNIVSDVFNNHLWAGQAAEAIWAVIRKNFKNNIFNIAGKDSISRFDLALKTAKIFDLDSSLVTPVTSDFFQGLAKRPKNTTFDTKKMEKQLGIKPLSINKGLRFMKSELAK